MRELEPDCLPALLPGDEAHVLDLLQVVGKAAPLPGVRLRVPGEAGVQRGDEVLEEVAAVPDGLQEPGLVLAGILDGDGRELDDLFHTNVIILVVVPRDGCDHEGPGKAASDVAGNSIGAEGAAHVDDAPAAPGLFSEDEVDDLGCRGHDIALVHPRGGDRK